MHWNLYIKHTHHSYTKYIQDMHTRTSFIFQTKKKEKKRKVKASLANLYQIWMNICLYVRACVLWIKNSIFLRLPIDNGNGVDDDDNNDIGSNRRGVVSCVRFWWLHLINFYHFPNADHHHSTHTRTTNGPAMMLWWRWHLLSVVIILLVYCWRCCRVGQFFLRIHFSSILSRRVPQSCPHV